MRNSFKPSRTTLPPKKWLSLGNLWLVFCLAVGGVTAAWVATHSDARGRQSPRATIRTVSGELTVAPIDRKIESAQVGMAAWSHNPTGEEDLQFGDHVDPATWKHLILRSQKADGSFCDINLLRPGWWINDQAAERGGTIYISVPECGIDGDAEVLEIRPCPPVQKCPPGYRTITGTFHHCNAKLIDLYIEGLDKPIGTTPNHPFWSVDRQKFVRADSLIDGERLLTFSCKSVRVAAIRERDSRDTVFNMEVLVAHAYCIGAHGILVHNSKPCAPNSVPVPDGHTRVYRAVSEAEYQDVLSSGVLRQGPNTMEGKWFADSLEGAKDNGNGLFPDGNFRLIEVDVPDNAASLFKLENLDGHGPARFLHNLDLPPLLPRALE